MRAKKDATYFTWGLITLVVAVIGIIAYLLLSVEKYSVKGTSTAQIVPTVSESEGIQYIDLTAKGGYFPANITAKANMKTILRVKTSGTFDCSSAFTIPSLGYQKNLPPTGTTEIEIPPQEKNYVLRGTCSMGMYRFSIKFI